MKYLQVTFHITPASEIAADVLSAMLADIGFETFMPDTQGLDAWIQEQMLDSEELRQTVSNFPLPDTDITYTVTETEDKDWNAEWEQNGFQPIIIPDAGNVGQNLVTIHDIHHTDIPAAKYDICIHPRQAFGTGSHQTTRMILTELTRMDLKGKTVIDAGTGTGVLAIMAAMLGAETVLAYDIDQWSVDNAIENIHLNGVGNINVCLGDSRILQQYPAASYDLLIANINRNILLSDMEQFSEMLKSGGKMILSGFYNSDSDILIERANNLGMSYISNCCDNDWTLLLMEKL